jgi:hypothetical protein
MISIQKLKEILLDSDRCIDPREFHQIVDQTSFNELVSAMRALIRSHTMVSQVFLRICSHEPLSPDSLKYQECKNCGARRDLQSMSWSGPVWDSWKF